ncbi:Sarcosine oxidase alpha subunit [Halanaerobium saccharolyticum subsp. saccharolyticum DSM 6643]|uniref:Sarcosine oxidase alpha subunit n=1 Tax=Halanaerobium saccharolyticum subsp. saccharolyticum DSM 6643 TaxID=1293054 RepID=M5E1B5_9FIRM|nr:FAD-dependent oxidoreductase [Halanaerobium saccharolyticum]CCU79587.1 Sarcosine oxidase alpha subunit [Halanaerobium saccharolyticum subsp. saccharolyticum DSM 6643]
MNKQEYDLVVVGGGPAGLAAAQEAFDQGIKDILIIERDFELGGILQQCIHNGFGLHYFGEELTGPEYAQQFIENIRERGVDIKLDTMVLEVTPEKTVYAINSDEGMLEISAGAVILAMGCRERTREAIDIPGSRPAGVYSAGTAQRYINMEQWIPGEKVVILGSGDIGLIMARRMHLEGAEVEAVLELLPFSGGLTRNIVQCLEDFDIPLRMQQTVIDIKGKDRLEAVTVAEVDDDFQPIEGTEYEIECDTLLLSVGLIPENELSEEAGVEMHAVTGGPVVNEGRETNIEGVFACGNVLHVHDLVDWVTEESLIAGKTAADYLKKGINKRSKAIDVDPGENVGYIVPHKITNKVEDRKLVNLYMRAKQPMTDVKINLYAGDKKLLNKKARRVEPGEMITFPVPEKMISSNDIASLKVDIVKEEE